MREHALLSILTVASVILVALFFLLSPNFITDNGEYKHFEDSDLSFDMYKSWTVYEYDDALKTPFLTTSPTTLILNPLDDSQFTFSDGNLSNSSENGVINTAKTNAFDVAIVKTEITKIDSLPDGVTLNDAYKADSLYSLMNSTGKFDLLSENAMTVGDREAHQFVYEVSGTTYQETWIDANGHYFRVCSQAPSAFMGYVQAQFDYLISTMKVK